MGPNHSDYPRLRGERLLVATPYPFGTPKPFGTPNQFGTPNTSGSPDPFGLSLSLSKAENWSLTIKSSRASPPPIALRSFFKLRTGMFSTNGKSPFNDGLLLILDTHF